MKSATNAARCALIFGTPISRSEFFKRAQGKESDYMSVVLGEESAEKVWSDYYERLTRAATDLLDTARKLGAAIFQRATLADFSYATAHYDQIVLMAHWRGAVVSASDIRKTWQRIVERIEIENDGVLRALSPAPCDLAGLVDTLNRKIGQRSLLHFLPTALQEVGEQSIALGRTLCRDLVDETLGSLIVPGNKVELFDGLHTLAEIDTALSTRFAGELDLTLCNSEALAVFLDLKRGNRVQHIHRRDLVDPLPQYLIVAETLRELAVDGGSYIKTRLRIEERL